MRRMSPVVKTLVKVFSSSIESRRRLVMKSAYSDGIPAGRFRKGEGGNGGDAGPGKVLVAIHPPVADDVGVHARAAEGLADLVHHQDIDVVDRKGGEVGEVALQQGGFLVEDVPGVDGMQFRSPVEAVLQKGEAGENLP